MNSRRASRLVWAVLVATLAVGATRARAQGAPTQLQIDWCLNNGNTFSAEQQINGCSAAIQSGRGTPETLGLSLVLRGTAYYNLKLFDAAIADYSRAIEFDFKEGRNLQQSRHGLRCEGRARPRHRGFRHDDPSRSKICRSL